MSKGRPELDIPCGTQSPHRLAGSRLFTGALPWHRFQLKISILTPLSHPTPSPSMTQAPEHRHPRRSHPHVPSRPLSVRSLRLDNSWVPAFPGPPPRQPPIRPRGRHSPSTSSRFLPLPVPWPQRLLLAVSMAGVTLCCTGTVAWRPRGGQDSVTEVAESRALDSVCPSLCLVRWGKAGCLVSGSLLVFKWRVDCIA